MRFQQKSKILQQRVRIFPSSDQKHVQQKLSCTSNINIKIIQKVFVYLLPAMFDIGGQPLPPFCFKIQRNPWQMIVDLRNNRPRSQIAPSRIKSREVQTTQMVYKKRHVLTIRYFQKSLKIASFALLSLQFEPVQNGRFLLQVTGHRPQVIVLPIQKVSQTLVKANLRPNQA